MAIIKQANTSVKGLSEFTPFVKGEIAPFPSFKTILIDTSIRSLPTWVQNETDKTVGFYLNSDDELYNRMLFSNDAYFNDLRSYDNEDDRGIFVSALSKLDEGETNLFNEVLAAEGEGTEPLALFRHLDTEIPEDFTRPLWESFGVPHEPEAPDLNASQLYDYMASSNAYATVAKYMADMLRECSDQAPEQTAAFLKDIINDDVIFKSDALRSDGSKFEYELSGVLYRSGDRDAMSGFFNQWEPAKDWLYDNTSLDQRMDIVYTSNPDAEIQSFITATMSNDVLERVIGGLQEITALDYVEKLVLSFPTQAQSITSVLGAATDTMTLAEHHIYGSSRLGIQTYDTTYRNTANVDPNVTPLTRLSANRTWYSSESGDFVSYTSKTPWAAIDNSAFRESRTVGKRYYEMTDHLGNVLATVMDRKTGHLPQGGGMGSLYDYWQADLASVQDYYPGGMMMPGRFKSMNGDTTLYRFGSQGQAKDNEVYGFGTLYAFEYRMQDTRLNRFWSADPLHGKYPYNSDYAFGENSLIQGIDLEGLELLKVNSGWFRMNVDQGKTKIITVNASNVPSKFKDDNGQPLFTPGSVGLTPQGMANSQAPSFRPSNRLPANPDFAWKQPEPGRDGDGGYIGLNLENNKLFAERANAIGSAPQEFFNWYKTFANDVPVWKAYSGLKEQTGAYDKAIGLTLSNLSFTDSWNPQLTADVTNFIFDGTMPPLDWNNIKGSTDYKVDVMKIGIQLMKDNRVTIQPSTLKSYEQTVNYQKQLNQKPKD